MTIVWDKDESHTADQFGVAVQRRDICIILEIQVNNNNPMKFDWKIIYLSVVPSFKNIWLRSNIVKKKRI